MDRLASPGRVVAVRPHTSLKMLFFSSSLFSIASRGIKGRRRSLGSTHVRTLCVLCSYFDCATAFLQRLALVRQADRDRYQVCVACFYSRRLIEGKTEWKVHLTPPSGLEVQAAVFLNEELAKWVERDLRFCCRATSSRGASSHSHTEELLRERKPKDAVG